MVFSPFRYCFLNLFAAGQVAQCGTLPETISPSSETSTFFSGSHGIAFPFGVFTQTISAPQPLHFAKAIPPI
jgi:hypothetical protein